MARAHIRLFARFEQTTFIFTPIQRAYFNSKLLRAVVCSMPNVIRVPKNTNSLAENAQRTIARREKEKNHFAIFFALAFGSRGIRFIVLYPRVLRKKQLMMSYDEV